MCIAIWKHFLNVICVVWINQLPALCCHPVDSGHTIFMERWSLHYIAWQIVGWVIFLIMLIGLNPGILIHIPLDKWPLLVHHTSAAIWWDVLNSMHVIVEIQLVSALHACVWTWSWTEGTFKTCIISFYTDQFMNILTFLEIAFHWAVDRWNIYMQSWYTVMSWCNYKLV